MKKRFVLRKDPDVAHKWTIEVPAVWLAELQSAGAVLGGAVDGFPGAQRIIASRGHAASDAQKDQIVAALTAKGFKQVKSLAD